MSHSNWARPGFAHASYILILLMLATYEFDNCQVGRILIYDSAHTGYVSSPLMLATYDFDDTQVGGIQIYDDAHAGNLLVLPMQAIDDFDDAYDWYQLCDTFLYRAYARLYDSHIASGTTVGDMTPGTPELVVY